MERDEFVKIVKSIDSVYCSNDKPLMKDGLAFELWFSCLKDIDFKVCGAALKNIFLTSRFRPTIAEIRGECLALTKSAENDLTEQSAWAMVRKALQNGYYGSEEEYNRLPEVLQEAVGHPSNLREWSQLPTTEVETVVQSQFLRTYRTVQQRAEKNSKVAGIGTQRGALAELVEHTAERIESNG